MIAKSRRESQSAASSDYSRKTRSDSREAAYCRGADRRRTCILQWCVRSILRIEPLFCETHNSRSRTSAAAALRSTVFSPAAIMRQLMLAYILRGGRGSSSCLASQQSKLEASNFFGVSQRRTRLKFRTKYRKKETPYLALRGVEGGRTASFVNVHLETCRCYKAYL